MKIWKMKTMSAVVAVTVSAAMWGCESDEFADAPSAHAEAVQSSGAGARGGLGPVQGSELPPGHPPIAPEQQASGQEPSAGGMAEANPIEQVAPSEYGQRGAILWDAPDHWEAREPSGSMRFAEYGVGQGAELTVFYFGPASGGAVEGNLQRWRDQLSGGPEPTISRSEVAGMRIHRFDGQGTYFADLPGVSDGPQEDQRLLGAIAETSQGLFFFRLLGDREVVSEEAAGFDGFVQSLRDGA